MDASEKKCLLMFSGGLDSVVAAHLLLEQGCDVVGLHFVLPFDAGSGKTFPEIRKAAQALGIPLRIEDDGEAFLSMLKNPRYGYGKHANPCVDCRIHRLKRAREIMEEIGAGFVATGEVLGQRPMSQRLDKLNAVAKRSGLKGYLLRPLSARLLQPTIPEQRGWIDRGKLCAISGRGRKEQLAHAKKWNLVHGTPAGGCLLTQQVTARRFHDLMEHHPDFSLNDLQCIALGRHFRLSDSYRLIVGRDEAENSRLEHLLQPGDYCFVLADTAGPTALGKAENIGADEEILRVSAALLARYSRFRHKERVSVVVTHENSTREIEAEPMSEAACMERRI